MTETILVVNAGSSSIKFQLFEIGGGDRLERRFKGQIEGIGTHPRLSPRITKGERPRRRDVAGRGGGRRAGGARQGGRVPATADRRKAARRRRPPRRAWRPRLQRADRSSTSRVLDRLERFVPLAPLHQPNNLAPIRAILQRQPQLLQVACFDTAFHRGHPEVADRFAHPRAALRGGRAPLRLPRPVLRIHRRAARARSRPRLPRAASSSPISAAALPCAPSSAGKSVESTMGFTALDGLPMGTRPGPARRRRRALPHEREGDEREGDRAPALQRLRAQGALRHQQRRARPARERGSARQAGARLLRLPHRALHRDARRRHGRHRRLRVHGRHRRERAGHPRGGRAAPLVARARACREGEREGRAPRSRASDRGSPATSFRPTRS